MDFVHQTVQKMSQFTWGIAKQIMAHVYCLSNLKGSSIAHALINGKVNQLTIFGVPLTSPFQMTPTCMMLVIKLLTLGDAVEFTVHHQDWVIEIDIIILQNKLYISSSKIFPQETKLNIKIMKKEAYLR